MKFPFLKSSLSLYITLQQFISKFIFIKMEKKYLSPKVPRPTKSEFLELSKSLGLNIDDKKIGDFQRHLDDWLEGYDKLLSYPPNLPPVKYPRTPGTVPSKSENKNNAWTVKTHIKGADKGKLHGKTVVVKDVICLAGVPMSAGTSYLEGYTPEIDATVITRLLDAGAIIVGKSNCECYAGGSMTSFKGPVHNPFKYGFSSGGSSSGSCAILGAGEADLSVATDGGGSIRIPSCWCGLYGMKPTFGLVPMTGIMSGDFTTDHCGPITRTLMDNALMLEVMAGLDDDEMDPRQRIPDGIKIDYTSKIKDGVKGLKIGILKEAFGSSKADPKVESFILKVIEKFKVLEANVFEVSCPEVEDLRLASDIISNEGFYQTFIQNGQQSSSQELSIPSLMKANSRWKDQADDLSDSLKVELLVSEHIRQKYPERAYGKAQNLARKARKTFKERFIKGEFDVLVYPTIQFLPKPHPPENCDLDQYMNAAFGMGRNNGPFNVSGNPTMTMPVGMIDGFPVGLSILGAHYQEALIYKVAYALEQNLEKK